jgi:hypothetical protein
VRRNPMCRITQLAACNPAEHGAPGVAQQAVPNPSEGGKQYL